MQAAYITISIIIVIAAILLTLVVIVQNSKGGGLAANFASGNQTFGIRQTADFLEKLTWGLAIVIMVLCVTATFVVPKENAATGSTLQENIQNTQQAPINPTFPAGTPAEASQAAAPANQDAAKGTN